MDHPDQIRPEWLEGRTRIGITAGASAPEVLVRAILARLEHLGVTEVSEMEGSPERVVFELPAELEDYVGRS